MHVLMQRLIVSRRWRASCEGRHSTREATRSQSSVMPTLLALSAFHPSESARAFVASPMESCRRAWRRTIYNESHEIVGYLILDARVIAHWFRHRRADLPRDRITVSIPSQEADDPMKLPNHCVERTVGSLHARFNS
jgi:hypothetical protein